MEVATKVYKGTRNIAGLVLQWVKGKSCIRFRCQRCEKMVEDGEMALYAWNYSDSRDALVFHKGPCFRGYEAEHGKFECTSFDLNTETMWLLLNLGFKKGKGFCKSLEEARHFPHGDQ